MKIQTKLKYNYLRYCFINLIFPNRNKFGKSDRKRVWIFLGADYGNLGDVAITQVQEDFLKRKYNDYKIVTIPISKTLESIPQVKKVIKANDIVTIVGGGNISDLYEDIEFLRQRVILSFSKNHVISFPQSIYLTETPRGVKEKRRIVKIYGGHKSLLILMRDRVSYQRMKELIPNANIRLAPDIVMSTDCRRNINRKNKVIVCMRSDKESTKTGTVNASSIIRNFQEQGFEIVRRDTQIDNQLIKDEGGRFHVDSFLNEVSSSSIMITNRLHGMIFAFITGTPAIVLDNSTGKVSATYEWIKDCGYIHLFNSSLTRRIDYLDLKIINFDQVSSHINQVLTSVIN